MDHYHETDAGWLAQINPQPHIAGAMVAPRGWVEADRVLYDHELVLFEGGQFVLRLEDEAMSVIPPAFVIVPPGVRHASWNRSEAVGFRRWVHFDWAYVDPPPRRLFTYLSTRPRAAEFRSAPPGVPAGLIQGRVENWGLVNDLHGRLCVLLAQGGPSAMRARGLLLELLLELLLCARSDAPAPPPHLPGRVRALLDVEAMRPIAQTARLADLLRRTGRSYEHVCRAFREHYGIPPKAYTMRLRIERAKVLLREGAMTVADVASAVGFSHHSHFSRVFHRLAGMRPSVYVARHGPSSIKSA